MNLPITNGVAFKCDNTVLNRKQTHTSSCVVKTPEIGNGWSVGTRLNYRPQLARFTSQ